MLAIFQSSGSAGLQVISALIPSLDRLADQAVGGRRVDAAAGILAFWPSHMAVKRL